MPWIQLIVAGILEVSWAMSLKYTEGFTRLIPCVFMIASTIASIYFLAQAVRE